MVILNLTHDSLWEDVITGWWEKITISDSNNGSKPVFCAANEEDYTLDLVLQTFNDSYDVVCIDVAFPQTCP